MGYGVEARGAGPPHIVARVAPLSNTLPHETYGLHYYLVFLLPGPAALCLYLQSS